MKVYIAGPISGTTDYIERFSKAAEQLREMGHDPINPAAESADLPADIPYESLLFIGLGLLASCNCIYLLKGWEKSIGANREYGFALGREMFVMREGDQNGS